MKKYLWLIILLTPFLFAGSIQKSHLTVIGQYNAASGAGPSWDLLDEDFEDGLEPSGWSSATCDTLDYDYATAPAPLYGNNYSMSLQDASSFPNYCVVTTASFAAQDELWIRASFNSNSDSSSYSAIRLQNAGSDTFAGMYGTGSGDDYKFYHESDATAHESAAVEFVEATTYTMWIHYKKETSEGAEDGILDWERCTDEAQTAGCTSGQISDGEGDGAITKILFSVGHVGDTTNKHRIFDNIKVSSSCTNGVHWDTCP